ncbi:MAG: helix-turn-helix transcriptional regulator [Solirubrobacterales bacterium]|nr:helix-turn-helix transcriptional regulator [Solirubrobacterales bacterium]
MIGREAELRVLHGDLDAVESGAARALAVVGDPWVGKSALLAAAAELARARSWAPGAVISGADAARLAPVLAVLRAAAGSPVLIVLDDLHRAPDDALAAVATLAAEVAAAGGLLALAYRPGGASEALHVAVGQVARELPVGELVIGPLDRDECDGLLPPGISPLARARLHERAGGTPGYMLALAAASESAAPPPAVVRSVAREIASLGAAAADVAAAAAVAGDRFAVDLAAELADLDEAAALATVDELVAARIVLPCSLPRHFRFRAPIVGEAIYAEIDADRARTLHRRAARALERRQAPPAELADHVRAAALPGDRAAAELLASVGERELLRDPVAAARWLGAADALAPAEDVELHRWVRPMHARALWAAGRLEECRTALRAVRETGACGTPEELARLAVLEAGVERLLDGAARADEVVARAEEELAGDPVAGALLSIERTLGHWFAGEWESIAPAAERAAACARLAGRRDLEVEAVALITLGHTYLGRQESAEGSLVAATALVERMDNHELARSLRALTFIGHSGFAVERYDDAARVLRRGLLITEATGERVWRVGLSTMLAASERWRGRLAAALEVSVAGAEDARLLGNDQFTIWARSVLAWVQLDRGEIDAAVAEAEAARAALARAGSSPRAWLPECTLGAIQVATGEFADARESILAGGGGAGLPRVEPSFRSHWYELLAHAELGAGRVEEARRWLGAAEPLVADLPLPRRRGELLRGWAAVALAEGEAARAAVLAGESVECFRDHPLDAARSSWLAGRALLAAGLTRRARARLVAAREGLASCGADRDRAAVDAELDDLAPADEATGVLAKLTRREGQVARLVATGATNRDIAARLAISERTAERHVSRAMARLSVTSRAALAAAVERDRGDGGR